MYSVEVGFDQFLWDDGYYDSLIDECIIDHDEYSNFIPSVLHPRSHHYHLHSVNSMTPTTFHSGPKICLQSATAPFLHFPSLTHSSSSSTSLHYHLHSVNSMTPTTFHSGPKICLQSATASFLHFPSLTHSSKSSTSLHTHSTAIVFEIQLHNFTKSNLIICFASFYIFQVEEDPSTWWAVRMNKFLPLLEGNHRHSHHHSSGMINEQVASLDPLHTKQGARVLHPSTITYQKDLHSTSRTHQRTGTELGEGARVPCHSVVRHSPWRGRSGGRGGIRWDRGATYGRGRVGRSGQRRRSGAFIGQRMRRRTRRRKRRRSGAFIS